MKILGLGNALLDILIQLDSEDVVRELNFPKGSMQLIDAIQIPQVTNLTDRLPSTMVSGGSAANSIHGLASLGVQCGFIGKVGEDRLGHYYENELKNLGVDTYLLRSEKNETGRAYTLISPDSERTFATFLGAAVELKDSDIDGNILQGFDILHVEGYLVQNTDLIERAIQLAKKYNLKVSLDLASYNVVESNHAFLSRIIPEYVDILFANEEEAKAYTGLEPEKALDKMANEVETAVVKIGKKGSLIRSKNQIIRISIDPVNSLDTTGAGDQYAAGFLFGYIKNLSPEKCGRIGSLLASKVVQYYGARIPKHVWPEVLKETQKILGKQN